MRIQLEEGSGEIRPMLEKDLDQVVELENASFSQPWSRDDFLEAIVNENKLFLIIELNQQIIGMCGYHNIVNEAEITNVAINSNFRKRKLGYQMLNQLLELGSKRGVIAFTLEVRVSNEGAIALYERLGFKVEGMRKDFYAQPQEDALIMWKR